MDEDVEAPTLTRRALKAAERRTKRRGRALMATAGALTIAGAGIATWALIQPEEAERTISSAVGSYRQVTQQAADAVLREGVPHVTLGDPGGQAELDACTGEFVEMVEYAEFHPGLQPTYSAHNGCGGDVLLPWELGQEVDITGTDGQTRRYVVTDERVTAQVGVTTADIAGMDGELLLQTCFWVADDMRFVALEPAA